MTPKTNQEPSGAQEITFFGLRHSDQDDIAIPGPASDSSGTLITNRRKQQTNTHRDARPASPSPSSSHLPSDYVLASDYAPGHTKSLAGIAQRAFWLGAALSLSIAAVVSTLLLSTSPLWRLPFFIGSLSLFHFLEFWTTAAYNAPTADIHAFLLTANWPAYTIAHAFACFECLITSLFWPESWLPMLPHRIILGGGLVLVIVGQVVRSAAMITAGRSFNHVVQHRKADSHTLVTSGIYAWFRHPSYFGFYWWAIGTQLVLGNAVSLVGYAVVLWKFFSGRIAHEENLLISFFGRDYEEYRRRVGTKMPFCG